MVNFREVGRRTQEGIVVLAAILVTAYAIWVIHDFRESTAVRPPNAASTSKSKAQQSESAQATKEARKPANLKAFATAVAQATNVLVIGDSTGDEPGEWVALWAQKISREQHLQVTLQQWDPVNSQFNPFIYGTGPPKTIWNLSYRVEQADYANRVGDLRATPDAILLNVGHDRTVQELDRTIGQLDKAVEKRWRDVPTAWILQNPSTGPVAKRQEAAVVHLREKAVEQRVPVIDVFRVFQKRGDVSALLLDGSRPNSAGSSLWANTIDQILRR